MFMQVARSCRLAGAAVSLQRSGWRLHQTGAVSPVARPTVGRLLVATPPLGDENFDRSVVYMLDHQVTGAFGIVLNRPSTVTVPVLVEEWEPLLASPTELFDGGPVDTDTLIALAEAAVEPAEGGWTAVHGSLEVVDLSRPASDVAAEVRRVRIFCGYAGWGPLQLDGEIEAGAWMVLPSLRDDVFTATPDTLWRDVLRRQSGRTAWIANAPDDIGSN